MALINCVECKKEISSEAAACPHCGFPLKPDSKKQILADAREAKSSKTGLGTLFLVLGIIGIVIGFVVNQPSSTENLEKSLVDLSRKNERDTRAFSGITGDYSRNEQARQDVRDAESDLSSAISGRQIKAACFFIPSGMLIFSSLILLTSGKRAIRKTRT